ncbi:hypothetical protein N7456_012711 [Penicillium angulare]|uniref:Uncharacterized protein n=1 Tax=Penicillium angulare TaxID=116970 RepID=A0A9W9EK75_9EURO|nr:hypothetical protein N7456_012711 [Penicillium angulare]
MAEKLASYTVLDPQTDDTIDFLNNFFSVLSISGQGILVSDILATGDNAELRALVESIWTSLVAPMQAQAGRTPQITPSPYQNLENSADDIPSEKLQPLDRSR